MMTQDVEPTADLADLPTNGRLCCERNDNEDHEHDQLPTVDEILLERGRGKILLKDGQLPTVRVHRLILLFKILRACLIVIFVVAGFGFAFMAGEFEGEKRISEHPSTEIHQTLSPIALRQNNSKSSFDLDENDGGFDPNAPITKDTPGVERHFITKAGLIHMGYALQGGSEFDDPSSYQSRALEVLLENGVLVHDPNDEKMGLDYQKLAQRYALLCLYYSTNGVRTDVTIEQFGYAAPTPIWHNDDGPSPWIFRWEEDECDWSGIICNADQLVTRIELRSHLLTGCIPAELELLNGGPIQVLDFSDNRGLGQGGIPTVFAEFDSLDSIGLRGTSFVGLFPAEICRRQNIKRIFVDCNHVSCDCCEPC